MVTALCLLALALAPATVPADKPGTVPRANIILVTLDTTRADHVGAWGWRHARTPNLDRLAREGAQFSACDTASVETLPSHATILTGCYPPRHGVRGNGSFALATGFPTLASQLARAGYDTAAVVSAIVLARRFGLDQGFRVYDDDLGLGYSTTTVIPERTAAAATDAAMRTMATLRAPFFLWVHYFDPHEEYRPPPRLGDLMTGPSPLYDGEIAFVDEQLGRLLAAAQARTTIVVVGDHGEMLGEHGEPTHGLLPYRAARRVPLIMHGAGIPPGLAIGSLVRTADIAPTLLEWAGVPAKSRLDGQSLQCLLAGETEPERESYCEAPLAYYTFRWYPLRALGTRDSLLLQAPVPSLYDLRDDPGEQVDRAAARGEVVKRLQARLRALFTPRGAADELHLPDGAPPDRESLQGLVSLGYLAGASGGPLSVELPDPRLHMGTVRRLAEAAHLVQQGRIAAALAILDSIIAEAPSGEPILALRGVCLLRLGRAEDALAAFRKAMSIEPRNPNHIANAATCLSRLGRNDDALAAARQALAIDPGAPDAALLVARFQRAASRFSDAVATLDRAIEAGARTTEMFLERASIHITDGKLSLAEADLRKALDRDPANALALERAAVVVNQLGRYREAAQLYERLVALQPERASAWQTLGALYLVRLDDPPAAARCFRNALRAERDPRRQQELREMLADLQR